MLVRPNQLGQVLSEIEAIQFTQFYYWFFANISGTTLSYMDHGNEYGLEAL